MVSKDKVEVDPAKVEVVLKWPQPKNVTEIRIFLRLAGYYRRFMEGFVKIANPMTTLTRNEHKYNWMESCKQSFQELKKRLITAPDLTIPEGSTEFSRYYDASKSELGVVLMQHGKVVTFASRQLKDYKTRYPTHGMELAAIVFALKTW